MSKQKSVIDKFYSYLNKHGHANDSLDIIVQIAKACKKRSIKTKEDKSVLLLYIEEFFNSRKASYKCALSREKKAEFLYDEVRRLTNGKTNNKKAEILSLKYYFDALDDFNTVFSILPDGTFCDESTSSFLSAFREDLAICDASIRLYVELHIDD